MERSIRITGKGSLSVKPDTVRLIMTMEGVYKDYDTAVEKSARMTEEMKDLFEELGFSRESVKTLYFNINIEYERYQAKDKSWKRRLEGYKLVHRIKIEFPADNKRLGKVLYALGRSALEPELQIEYTVAEPEKYKNELLTKAVMDSKQKAEVLVRAAEVSLGDIVTIDYSWGEIEFVTRPMDHSMLKERCMMNSAAEADAYEMDINPDDIKVSDNVTIVWDIR